MAGQPLSRRSVLAGMAGGLVAAATPSFAQEPVAFVAPQNNEVLDAYEIETIGGYTKITMDHVRQGPDAEGANVLDVQAIRTSLNQAAREIGARKPIIITDYAYDGPSDMYPRTVQRTAEQDELFEKVLPVLAQQSQRPIVHLRVSAYGTKGNELEALHDGALMADVRNNKLGPNGTYAEAPNDIALPYLSMRLGEDLLYDTAMDWYGDTPSHKIQGSIAGQMINVAIQQNQILTAELEL